MIDRIEKSPGASNLTKFEENLEIVNPLVREALADRGSKGAGENSLGTCQRENHF